MVETVSTPRPKRTGFANLSWLILVGGFAGGILGGAYLVSLLRETPDGDLQAVAKSIAHVDAAGTADANQPSASDSTTQLQQEVTNLKQELEAERLRKEVAQLRRELSVMKHGEETASAKSKPRTAVSKSTNGHLVTPVPSIPSASSSGALTLAYWNSLNEIIVREASMRSAPLSGLSAANAAEFLNRRVDAGKYASGAMRKLDKAGVDPEVVALAGKLARWYDDNASVAGSGGNLLGSDLESRQGQAGKQYQSGEKGLQQSVSALNREGEAIRGKMSRKYGLDFPKLQ